MSNILIFISIVCIGFILGNITAKLHFSEKLDKVESQFKKLKNEHRKVKGNYEHRIKNYQKELHRLTKLLSKHGEV